MRPCIWPSNRAEIASIISRRSCTKPRARASTWSTNCASPSATTALAHKLNIKVIAESIETQQQLSTLTAAGCDFGQGFLLSRLISGEELKEKLQKQVGPVNK
nr:EAL domain-containing protein [uncultured Duganella sp.]